MTCVSATICLLLLDIRWSRCGLDTLLVYTCATDAPAKVAVFTVWPHFSGFFLPPLLRREHGSRLSQHSRLPFTLAGLAGCAAHIGPLSFDFASIASFSLRNGFYDIGHSPPVSALRHDLLLGGGQYHYGIDANIDWRAEANDESEAELAARVIPSRGEYRSTHHSRFHSTPPLSSPTCRKPRCRRATSRHHYFRHRRFIS